MRHDHPPLVQREAQEYGIRSPAKVCFLHVEYVKIFAAQEGNDGGMNVFVGQQRELAQR